jgi:phosphotransacetylase
MIDESTKDLIKKLFNDILYSEGEISNNNKNIKEILEKNEEYKILLKKKKEIDEELKQLKEKIASTLIDQNDKIKENIKIIKNDLCEKLESKSTIVNQVYKFFKTKYKGDDQLQEITDKFVEIFEVEDE